MKNFPLKLKVLYLTFMAMLLTCSLPRTVWVPTTTFRYVRSFTFRLTPMGSYRVRRNAQHGM